MHIRYKQLQDYLAATFTGEDADILGVSTDTRTLNKGDLFVALTGENFDGHAFIDQAIQLGAGGLLISKPFTSRLPTLLVQDTLQAYGKVASLHRAQFTMPVVAITGSCGKTTVKEMLVSILQKVGEVAFSKNNYNNEVGVPQSLLSITDKHAYAVIEMGARKPGDIAYLMDITKPSHALITKAAVSHLDYLKDLDGVAKVKGEIYKNLCPNGTAIINVDDVYAPYWISLLNKQEICTFGLEHMADVTCAYIKEENNSTIFEILTDVGTEQIKLPLLGRHNVMNALAAAAIARTLGVVPQDIKLGLESVRCVRHRLEIKYGHKGVKVIDDSYNANPSSMQAALSVLANEKNKTILVMGDMGELGEKNHAVTKHVEVGKNARAMGIKKMMAVGELSKSAADSFGGNAKHYLDKNRLIDDLLNVIDADTTVLIKGSRFMRLEEVASALVKKY